MRLIIVTAAALLLAGAAPALAHTTQLDEPHTECAKHSRIDDTDPYNGSMTVHESLYAQAGWWDGQKASTGNGAPSWACGGDPGKDADQDRETRTSPVWLLLQESSLGDSYQVEVTSQSGVVAAVDVFEYQESQEWSNEITPPCPQGLVLPDLYPESGEPSDVYLRRVLSETVGAHQRGQSVQDLFPVSVSGERSISLSLDPADSDNGAYIVAIYPQAATNLDANGAAGLDGADSISWDVYVEEGEMVVDDGQARPDLPYEANKWIFPTGHLFDCVDKGVPLPPLVTGGGAPELTTPPSEDAGSLLTTHLPDPA